jgi:hypothetical protein
MFNNTIKMLAGTLALSTASFASLELFNPTKAQTNSAPTDIDDLQALH